jgi:hypothetical protein
VTALVFGRGTPDGATRPPAKLRSMMPALRVDDAYVVRCDESDASATAERLAAWGWMPESALERTERI